MKLALPLVLTVLAGCLNHRANSDIGSAWSGADATGPEGPNPPAEESDPEPREALPDDVVARAAMPFHGVRVSDGQPLSSKQLLDELSRADAICVAEQHDNPHDHYAQVVVLRGLARRAPNNGRELGLGLEMFQLPFQEVLNDYVQRKIDEDEMLEQAQYDERWGFDFALYRPLLRTARRRGLPALALNAPKELTTKVSKRGLRHLDEADAKQLPDIDLSDGEHRKWFEQQMAEHPHAMSALEHGSDDAADDSADGDASEKDSAPAPENPHGSHHGHVGKDHGKKYMRRMYAAQLVWDETMAQTAATWLRERQPARQLVIVAGVGHCQRRAIPNRMRRRKAGKVVGVLPYVAHEADAAPEDLSDFDYAFVMTPEE